MKVADLRLRDCEVTGGDQGETLEAQHRRAVMPLPRGSHEEVPGRTDPPMRPPPRIPRQRRQVGEPPQGSQCSPHGWAEKDPVPAGAFILGKRPSVSQMLLNGAGQDRTAARYCAGGPRAWRLL